MKIFPLIITLIVSIEFARADESEWLRPFWASKVMHGESVLFIKKGGDAEAIASLLFVPTKILSVKSSSGEVVFEEGRDFLWQKGTRKISLPAGSRIVSKTTQEMRRPDKSQRHVLTHRDGNGEIFFAATHQYHDLQTVITYAHSGTEWNGVKPSFAGKQLPKILSKLKKKEPLKVVLLGDSISTGCNASGWADVAPRQPAYQDLFVNNLKTRYQCDVFLKNLSIGGKDTAWGFKVIDDVIEAKPDLVVIAFGMNDAVHRPAADYRSNTKAMINAVRKANPDAEFILIATMLGNKNWTRMKMDLVPQYREVLAGLSGSGVALADMTSIWEEMLKHKSYLDLTGNGVNHPNDFGHRVYAQVLSALLILSDQNGFDE